MFSDSGVGFKETSWDFGGQVNRDTAGELFKIIVRELRAVLDDKLTDEEIETAKSYATGRYQMGAQTVSQISNFYTYRYFADDKVRDYDAVPRMISEVTKERIHKTVCEFIREGVWVLAGVSSGDKAELVEHNDVLTQLFSPEEN